MLTRKQQELLLFINDRLQAEGIPPSFDEMKDALALKSKSGIHRLITALEERGFIRRLPNRARALEILRLPEGHNNRLPDDNRSGAPVISQFSQDGPSTGARQAQPPQARNMPGLARRGFTPSIIDGGLSDDGRREGASDNIVPGGFGESSSPSYDIGSVRDEAMSGMQIPVMGRIAAGVPIEAIENHTHSMTIPPDMVGAGEHFALQVEGESMIDAGIHDGDTVIIQKASSATLGDIVVALVDDEEATLKRFRRQGNSIALEAANPEFETRVFDAQRVKVQGRLVGLIRKYN